jgi:hypothetical protein
MTLETSLARDVVSAVAISTYINDSDRFPAFTHNITTHDHPKKFKPVGITRYNGKLDPR